MAANPIVVAKANQLFPDINFGFMTWLQGSIVPALVCATFIPLIIRRSLGLSTERPERGKHAREGHNVIQHAQMELNKMGPVSLKEWVK
jgi:DASS family divalent anion:Na+ symporter